MKQRRPPRLAAALLHFFSADQALIGDLLEEYERRRSRVWLWRQVTAAVAVGLSGRARDTQPHRWKAINLTAAPRGSAVGGRGRRYRRLAPAPLSPRPSRTSHRSRRPHHHHWGA
jgi:hypothetical protein